MLKRHRHNCGCDMLKRSQHFDGRHLLRRRELLTRSLSLFATPLVAAPLLKPVPASRRYPARTIDLVAESNVIDMLGLLTLNWSLLDRWHQDPTAFSDSDFRKLRSSGIDVFHPAVAFETGQAHEVTRAWFEKWNRLIAWHPDYFLRVAGPNDLARAKQEGRVGIILGMQDANHLRSVDDVDEFYQMGQRLTQLTYNSENRLGDGCKATRDRGLTGFGAEVVARMNSTGMAIDVSHCGQRTSLDAISSSKKPVLITHSNCRALAPGTARCKPDEVIRAAARGGGRSRNHRRAALRAGQGPGDRRRRSGPFRSRSETGRRGACWLGERFRSGRSSRLRRTRAEQRQPDLRTDRGASPARVYACAPGADAGRELSAGSSGDLGVALFRASRQSGSRKCARRRPTLQSL